MRIKIRFIAEHNLLLPLSCNEILQGFIYRHLSQVLGDLIHNHGFKFSKRQFRLFTFSRLLGKVTLENGLFSVTPPFTLIISSPYHDILQSLAENLMLKPHIELNKNPVRVESVTVSTAPPMKDSVTIKMLSPVTIYSTLLTSDGKKKTYYYNPRESEFADLIAKNIYKKYIAFHQKEPKDSRFRIEPLNGARLEEKIIKYKDFIIKGWMGKFKLSASDELLDFAYDAGIGAKNSQGFGCFDVVDELSQQEVSKQNTA